MIRVPTRAVIISDVLLRMIYREHDVVEIDGCSVDVMVQKNDLSAL